MRFNPRSRVGSDARGRRAGRLVRRFNPRSRVGSDRGHGIVGRREDGFQSTLPRGERLRALGESPQLFGVSIHAPAWGATRLPNLFKGKQPVSIHAPAWGATLRKRCSWRRPCSFNPRSRVGSDASRSLDLPRLPGFNPRSRVGSDDAWPKPPTPQAVSIHAPAWGATIDLARDRARQFGFNPRSRVGSDRRAPKPSPGRGSFNPRSRVGSDPPSSSATVPSFCFNPRSRVGSDASFGRARCNTTCFNPRSRVGSDAGLSRCGGPDQLFQSTLPRGERLPGPYDPARFPWFQSTLPRGERRRWPSSGRRRRCVSIHAPAWGATFVDGQEFTPFGFQSTLPRGERPHACKHRDALIPFQSTLPRGERLGVTPGRRKGCLVSIHAPAWGATAAVSFDCLHSDVSIHAPAWGATRLRQSDAKAPKSFNPRSRVGSDKQWSL